VATALLSAREPDSRATEGDALRSECGRLRGEHKALEEATNRLRRCRDRATIHAHHQRIRNHQARLNGWSEVLTRFHHQYGPAWLVCSDEVTRLNI
jgi:hypothetical protein